jgi:hypothetical protein
MNIFNISILLAFIFILIILYFIKRRKIEFSYSLFWFSISIVLFVLAIDRDFLESIADFFGVDYAPSLLFIGGILFNIVVNFYITIKISDMKKKMTRLTQEVGILRSKLENEERI